VFLLFLQTHTNSSDQNQSWKVCLFLGEKDGLSCFVKRTPKSISTEPVGFTSIVLLPKIVSKNPEFT
jgi:hypothetical protein